MLPNFSPNFTKTFTLSLKDMFDVFVVLLQNAFETTTPFTDP